jgi:hypothetical protein
VSAQDRIKNTLDELFARGRDVFPKLTKSDEPYRFTCWGTDNHGQMCLYYRFANRDPNKGDHKKRVPLYELVKALRECLSSGTLTRKAFERVCPVAQSAGGCGFAVTGGCLELLGVARYSGEDGFVLEDRAIARRLLGY